jgi:hypothetical protein
MLINLNIKIDWVDFIEIKISIFVSLILENKVSKKMINAMNIHYGKWNQYYLLVK